MLFLLLFVRQPTSATLSYLYEPTMYICVYMFFYALCLLFADSTYMANKDEYNGTTAIVYYMSRFQSESSFQRLPLTVTNAGL